MTRLTKKKLEIKLQKPKKTTKRQPKINGWFMNKSDYDNN